MDLLLPPPLRRCAECYTIREPRRTRPELKRRRIKLELTPAEVLTSETWAMMNGYHDQVKVHVIRNAGLSLYAQSSSGFALLRYGADLTCGNC
jgi:hypothetical protein